MEIKEVQEKGKVILKEFENLSMEIVGVYFDSISGFEHNIEWMNKTQKETFESIKIKNPDFKIEDLDKAYFIYGDGIPEVTPLELYHNSTQKEYKIRNSKEGKNCSFIGNMCLITIYQYWEDNYRERLAKLFSVKKDDIKSDLFGDIGIIRNSIIHNNSIASSKVNKCKLLKWFKPSDEIFINKGYIIEILRKIRKHKFIVENLKKSPTSDSN